MRTLNFFFGFVFLILGGLAFLPGAAAAAIVAGSAGMLMLTSASVEIAQPPVTVFGDTAAHDRGETVRVVELEDAAGIVVFAMKDGKLTSRFFRTQRHRPVLS